MATCKVTNPVQLACGDLLYPGGADGVFYVGYISELGIKLSNAQIADISSLTFMAYAGLRKFEGTKFAHNFGSEIALGAGKNISYTHRGTVKLITQSTADDVSVQQLSQSTDAFIIYQNNNNQWMILGPTKGLSVAAGPLQTTGTETGADISDTLILEGAEKTKPLRFFSVSETATQTLLDSYVR